MTRSPELVSRARALISQRLSPALCAHSERTSAAAVVLADRFGVDVGGAELAGLLHDYARDQDPAALVATAESLGVAFTPFEREHPHLLHARVGAAMVRRDLPGLGEAVLSAIEVHTVGAVPMSGLDMVVYLADMTESGRNHPGLDDLRSKFATESLDECFRLAYGRTLRHLKEAGRPVHPISDAVIAAIESGTGRPLYDFTPPALAVSDAEPVAPIAAETEDAPDDAPADETFAPAEEATPEDEAAVEVARHGRRRRAARWFRRTLVAEEPEPMEEAKAGPAGALGRAVVAGVKRAAAFLLVLVVLLGALWGLVIGINAFARWNALRVAALGGPTSNASENLLVVGVRGGVAVGFTALKLERDTGRVLGIAIPEAAFMEIPGSGFERIGSSYGAGAGVSESAVSNYFGAQFERYVAIDGDAYQALLQTQNMAALTDPQAKTDLTAEERESLTEFLKQVKVDDVWIVPLPVKVMTAGSEQYFEPQRQEVADLLMQWWGVQAGREKARTKVIVYDGVGTSGLATQAAQQLIRAGFQVVDSGNADRFGYTQTTILVYHAPAEAQAVRDALGAGIIQAQSAPQQLTDMIVILGADYLPPVKAPSNK